MAKDVERQRKTAKTAKDTTVVDKDYCVGLLY